MSKIIKLNQELIEKARSGFNELLEKGTFPDGKITYTYDFGKVDRKATLTFTELAWLKMHALIRDFDTEIAWNGIAYRGENDDYIVKDIVVFPQFVTGVTVERNKEEYLKWNMSIDDETFRNLRMHGHSHVNMGVSPSATDTAFYNDEILTELSDGDFYIFVIWNKKNERTIKIYDYEKNILFETSDVTVMVENNGIGIEDLVADAKSKLKTKPIAPPKVPSVPSTVQQSNFSKATETKSKSKYKKKEINSRSGYNYSSPYYGYSYYNDYDDDDDYNNDYAYFGSTYMKGTHNYD